MSNTFSGLEESYNSLIQTMVIRPRWVDRMDLAARKILKYKDRYQEVSDALETSIGTTVPWQFIGIVHHLESDGDFTAHLHNGDPLTARTVQVPAGRPPVGEPPFTWESSAIDALKQRGLELVENWSPARMAYEFEGYNGWGYRGKEINSPYLWSGTNHYSVGKYVKDGVYNPDAISQQCGAMAIFSRIVALDINENKIVDGSKKLTLLRNVKAAFSGTFGSYFTLDYFNMVPDYVKKFSALGISKEIWVLLGIGGISWVVFSIVEHMAIKDYKNGDYTPSKKPENDFSKDTKL